MAVALVLLVNETVDCLADNDFCIDDGIFWWKELLIANWNPDKDCLLLHGNSKWD